MLMFVVDSYIDKKQYMLWITDERRGDLTPPPPPPVLCIILQGGDIDQTISYDDCVY